MRMGIFLRNFGPVSTPENISACARAADSMGLDDLWVSDHVAISPAEAEGSGGRYMDPLATLAFIAGITDHVGIGTSVLIVPYRPALITAKWLATIQEFSAGRLTIGASVGWMESEFRAVDVEISKRGVITDETLAFWHDCFANDELESNGQPFIFKPRPRRPKFLIGGAAPHALNRVVRYGDGWIPAEGDPEKLRGSIVVLNQQMRDAGKAAPQIIPLTGLPLDDTGAAVAKLSLFSEIGVTGINHAGIYNNVDEFKKLIEQLQTIRSKANLD